MKHKRYWYIDFGSRDWLDRYCAFNDNRPKDKGGGTLIDEEFIIFTAEDPE